MAPHVLIKTHCWSDDWDPNAYPDVKIFLTHRDLRGVVASYMRLGWAFDVPSSYVADHQRWQVSEESGCCRQACQMAIALLFMPLEVEQSRHKYLRSSADAILMGVDEQTFMVLACLVKMQADQPLEVFTDLLQ